MKRIHDLFGVPVTDPDLLESLRDSLAEIRDKKLYRATHQTFEDYIKDKYPNMKTSQNTLRETSTYSCFVYNTEQRPVDVKHVRDLMESMKTFGFLPSKPVQTYQDGKKFVIIDGHHRFVAAKNLGIPVIYIAEPKSHADSMSRVNGLQKTWQLKNYLAQYVKRGFPAYLELQEYSNLGFSIQQAAKMLAGLSAAGYGGGKVSVTIRDGTFKVIARDKIEIIAVFLREDGARNAAYRTTNFITAFELCLRVDDFSHEQLTRKLSANPKAITRTATVDQMLDQIEEVYNYHQQIKTPLAFVAKQKKRSSK